MGTVGVRYDPHEWMNCVHHSGPGNAEQEGSWLPAQPGQPSPGADLMCVQGGPILGRGTVRGLTKVFAPQCNGCAAQGVCDGIDPSYVEANGVAEFVPYSGDLRGTVLDRDRLAYLPGHVIKLAPRADVKQAVKRLLSPQPIPDNPLVSVIIPHFNHADTVERCLRSVAAQTWKNIEIILVDDASTDGIRKVMKGIKLPNLKCVWRKQNSGRPAVPRNEGIRRSKGDLVLCLDPDDWIEPSMIEEHIHHFRRNPSASFVYSGLQTFGLVAEQWPARPFNPGVMITHNFVPYCSVWRREVWEDVGGYDEDMALKGCEDWNFWVCAVRNGHMGLPLTRQLVHYSRSADGLFEAEVRPNYPEKRRLVLRKNHAIYPADQVMAAFADAAGE
ncbi:MAG: glycosyltransferase family 2 protein [Magnetospirillum sp.]|nr:glycosyltransferase family 2 protein [Magnetospirillum sp.]